MYNSFFIFASLSYSEIKVTKITGSRVFISATTRDL